jgi:transposase
MRYELTDHEWAAIEPMLPSKPRGVPRTLTMTCALGILP